MISSGAVRGGMLASYYEKDNYYFKSGIPEIGGDGIREYDIKQEEFGLTNFEAICNLRDDATRSRGGKRPIKAYDYTFSAPKSVSILHGLGDEHLSAMVRQCQEDAVRATMQYMEDAGLFKCREKIKGKYNVMQARGVLYTMHYHDLNRNTEPDAHTHVLIANVCKDLTGKTRALYDKEMSRNKIKLDQIYKAHLAKNLRENGIELELSDPARGFWEVEGIDRKAVEAFSTRRMEILEAVAVKSSSKEERNTACIRTRKKKSDDVDRNKLRQDWESLAIEKGIDIKLYNARAMDRENIYKPETLIDFAAKAVEQLERFQGVFSKNDLIAETAKQSGASGAGLPEIRKTIDENFKALGLIDLVPPGHEISLPNHRMTTNRLLEAEKHILQYMQKGKGVLKPLDSDAKKKLEKWQKKHLNQHGWNLNAEQEESAMHVLNGTDKLIGIQGYAGTGKTTMFSCVNQIKDDNIQIIGLSNQAVAAKNLEKETGIKSQTIDSFLLAIEKGKDVFDPEKSKRLVIVDEASFAGSLQLDRLLRHADDLNYRVCLVGDKDQLQAVVAGKPFEQLQAAGMLTKTLKDIRRQKPSDLREIVTGVAVDYDVKAAMDFFEKRDCIVEMPNSKKRWRAVAKEFVADFTAGKDTLAITQTNKSRRAINDEVRFYLKKEGLIEEHDHQFVVLDSQDRESQRGFSRNDRIVFLENDKKLGVQNGNIATIKAIDGEQIQVEMEDGKSKYFDAGSYKKFDHGFVLTTYKSQGKTHDKCIYDVSAKSGMTNRNEFYVGISRERHEVKLFTDNVKGLRSRIARKQDKPSALDQWNKLKIKMSGVVAQAPLLQHQPEKAMKGNLQWG